MSTAIGREAEDCAADYLKTHNFKILDRNWRTRWCEIDIVATRNNKIYFFEVKFRAKPNWGSGFDYITMAKLKQMTFAAEFWLAKNRNNSECTLGAIELTGEPPKVIDIVEC